MLNLSPLPPLSLLLPPIGQCRGVEGGGESPLAGQLPVPAKTTKPLLGASRRPTSGPPLFAGWRRVVRCPAVIGAQPQGGLGDWSPKSCIALRDAPLAASFWFQVTLRCLVMSLRVNRTMRGGRPPLVPHRWCAASEGSAGERWRPGETFFRGGNTFSPLFFSFPLGGKGDLWWIGLY
ncbi:MAG: hypothetical protein [Microvirus sp.]|nr:MAG: hypothetical protein [Microvirus sp.]